jgi:glycosyltransferase involved in cell wall biosynthesis
VRILYFADIRFPLERANGIQTMETCHALARRGHRVRLIVRPDTQAPARDPFEYYGLPPTGHLAVERAPVFGPQAARRLGYLSFMAGRASGPGRADVLVTRDLGVAALIARLPRSLRAPLVYESHGYAPDVAAALHDLVATASRPGVAKLERLARREVRVWTAAEGYITITAGLADELASRFGSRADVAVIPDGVRLPANREWTGLPDPANAPIVGYAGHLYAWKGVDVLLDALARTPDVRGLIVGGHEAEPDLARTQSAAERLGLAARVTFTGHVPPARVADLLGGATILVLPNPPSAISTRFTSPLKLFEYMAAGRAIVASDLPSIREVLTDGTNALLVPPGDADALAAAIARLTTDRALATRLARAAFEAAADYTWDRRAERMEALFERVRSRHRR